ncbi:DUF1998 domain-containing protein [Cylindrospermopsis raciborskii Cr2010]|uniref:DUF1998 domain-containing protein n=1 Tax=Cylindrospermopsis raciborskii TaxID=77022 RepID=UPI001C69866F|nr:DUF1998 domain-containing protein [Cylindrospermopsis raciborskii]UJL32900.1 DUF1998 domain-containing protein [Cylindrospermopsis raciborskii Cr2010]
MMCCLKQVIATTSDRESRFGDENEDRDSSFFKNHLLVDFDPSFKEYTYLVKSTEFPFGFEYISRTKFREINLGKTLPHGKNVEIAGENFFTEGFRICKGCGKILRKNNTQSSQERDHALTCKWRERPEAAETIETLYLYREFESESIRFLMPDQRFWSEQGLHSFIAALQLGLKQKFGGRVDHLQITQVQEPQPDNKLRKSFLYLYDTVPGGTGYLRQLCENRVDSRPEDLRQVFQQALNVLINCSCQERGEDGCYKCLFAYRNSFHQDFTSSKAAQSLLSEILNHWSDLGEEKSQNLSGLSINSDLESELESKFIQALTSYTRNGEETKLQPLLLHGKKAYYLKIGEMAWNIELQVPLGKEEGLPLNCRADFVFYPAHSRVNSLPIVVFTDGWEYHQERIDQDLEQRLGIIKTGDYWCWSLTWADIDKQLNQKTTFYNSTTDYGGTKSGMDSSLNNPQINQRRKELYEHYQCSQLAHLEDKSSWEWLMDYLYSPIDSLWQNWALLRTILQAQKKNQTPPAIEDFLAPQLEMWNRPQNYHSGVIELSKNLEIFTLVDHKRNKELNKNGSLVLIRLQEIYQSDWQEMLRMLNLYQFLPYTYAMTTTSDRDNLSTMVPTWETRLDTNIHNNISRGVNKEWQSIKELIIEEDLVPWIDQMIENQWNLPVVGYELENKKGAVIASAELSWVEEKVSIVTTVEDKHIFEQTGWHSLLVEEVSSQIENLNQFLKTTIKERR